MKKLLFLVFVALLMSGCVVYPGYYGYYDSGYYGYPYGYVSPRVNLYFHGGHGDFRGHGGWGHGGWHR